MVGLRKFLEKEYDGSFHGQKLVCECENDNAVDGSASRRKTVLDDFESAA